MDAAYISRRSSLTEAEINLPCGVTLAYFRDGAGGGVPVLAFHDCGDSKWAWVMRKRIAGVDLVAIDRPGYGGSAACESWEVQLLAYKELADLLGVGQFLAMGHGAGGAVAVQLAAALPTRVRGLVLFAPLLDPLHPLADDTLRDAQMMPPAFMHPRSGCLGCVYRMLEIDRVAGDVKAQAEICFQEESAGVGYSRFEKDLFWFSCRVDAWNSGGLSRQGMLHDSVSIVSGKHPYDSALVRCPVSIWHGTADLRLRLPECTHYQRQLLPHAAIFILEQEGHTLICGPNNETVDRILLAIKRSPTMS